MESSNQTGYLKTTHCSNSLSLSPSLLPLSVSVYKDLNCVQMFFKES